MPHTVAPPPWNGDAATGHWSPAAPDSAPSDGAPSDARTSEPALQAPVAAARTAAAGVASSGSTDARWCDGPAPEPDATRGSDPPAVAVSARRALATGFVGSACALLVAGVAVATAAALRLLLSGGGRMTFSLTASALLLAGFAVAVAAALAMPNRWTAPRPLTLVLAVIVSVAWPLSGSPALAAVAAVAVVGLALAHDARHPGGVRVLRGWLTPALLAGSASALVIAGVALAQTHRIESAPVALAPERSPAEPSLGETPPEGDATDTGAAEAEPEATAAPSDPAAKDSSPDSPTRPDANDTSTDTPTSPDAKDTPTDAPTAPDVKGPSTDSQDTPTDTPTAPDDQGPSTDSPRGPDLPSSPGATTPTDPGTTTSPSDPAATAPSQDPADFVRGYYEQLNAKRFADAWASLSPAVRESFGGLEHWRRGYGRTISSTPSAFKVDGATVTHVLTARDRGCADRRFRVRWRLEPAVGSWTVAALSASALNDVACS